MTTELTVHDALLQAAQLERSGRLHDAARAYRGVLERFPDLPGSWFNLAVVYRKLRMHDTALAAYQQALDRGIERPEEVHLNRAVIYADCLHRPEQAERELAQAIRVNPRYVPALLNLANLHEDRGRRTDAIACYECILALDPDHADALARLANATPVKDPGDPLIARLEAAVAGATDPGARATLGFALGKALDAAGAYERAFAAYAAANRDSRLSMAPPDTPYDRRRQEQFTDELIGAFDGRTARAVGSGPVRPIFICGMFRSGSTLIEQVLAAHSGVESGGELDFVPVLARSSLAPFPAAARTASAAQFGQMARHYEEALGRLFPGDRRVTDKRPDNFMLIGLIKSMFPDARIIHTTRDALDNCLSIYFLHLDHRMGYALDLVDIGHYYRHYRRLMRHWRALYGDDILDVGYEDLVQDPEPAARRVLAHCGLPWEGGCLEFWRAGGVVKTASVWQVRQPLYRHAVGRWRDYAEPLRPLREYLAASQE